MKQIKYICSIIINLKRFYIFFILIFLVLNIKIYPNELKIKTTEFKFISKNSDEKQVDISIIDNNLKIMHAIFAGIAYGGLWTLNGIGAGLLAIAFTNTNYQIYQPLQYAHIGFAISTMLSFATVIILAFTKIAFKIKNKMPIRKTHLIAACVTLGFYILELSSIITAVVMFTTYNPNAKYFGIAHGVVGGLTTAAFTVSLITIFL